MKGWIIALSSLGFVVACDPADSPAANGGEVTEPEAMPTIVAVEAENNGQTVELVVGQTLEVKLMSIPTAGYTWQAKDVPAFLSQTGEDVLNTSPEQSEPGFTGGNHWIVQRYEATEAGEGRLTLIEGRPWELEEGGTPDDTWTLDVKVVPKP